MEWKWEQGTDHWVECYGDKWVRWSTVTRIEIVDGAGRCSVVFVTDQGAGENRIKWKDGATKEEARKLLVGLFDGLRGH